MARERYAAFLSYAHASDAGSSVALRDALQGFGKPWYRPRALRVFRDNSSLSATEALWPSIQAALEQTRFLILLASPESAASTGVAHEVEWWLANRDPSSLLLVVTGGELRWDPARGDFDRSVTTSLPSVLFGRLSVEPRWVDLRALPSSRWTLRDGEFRDLVADLAAPLHGMVKDDLVGADIREHQRTRRVVRAAISVLSVLTLAAAGSAGVAVTRFVTAEHERARADEERELAEARQRDALVGQLLAEADVLRGDGDLVGAARRALAALYLRDDDGTRGALYEITLDSPLVARLPGHEGGAYGLAYSPDGTMLATSGEDRTVSLWDVTDPYTPRRIGEPLTGHADTIFDVQFSPDGKLLATADLGGTVILWDVGRREPIGTPLDEHTGGVAAVAFAPDQPILATASQDGTVILWDISDPAAPSADPLEGGHEGEVWSAAFSPDGRVLATGGGDGSLVLWDVAAAEVLATPETDHTAGMSALAFAPDGQHFVTGWRDGVLRLWDLTDLTLKPEEESVVDPVVSVSFSPEFSPENGGSIVVGGQSRAVTFLHLGYVDTQDDPGWRLTSGFATPEIELDRTGGAASFIVRRVQYSPDGGSVAVAADDGTVTLWNAVSGYEAVSMPLSGAVAAPFPDGRTALVADLEGGLARWDVTDPAGAEQIAGPEPAAVEAVSIAVSTDGELAATVGFEDGVRLWDTSGDGLEPIGEPLRPGDVRSAAFSPDARTLATASTDQGATLWDISDPAHPVILAALGEGDGHQAWSVAYSPDGRTVAVASLTEETTLWDVTDPARPQQVGAPLPTRRTGTYSVAFSPDGSILAAGDADGSVALWDVSDPATATSLGRPFTALGANVRSLSFSPDGTLLASAGDGQLAVTDIRVPAHPIDLVSGFNGHIFGAFTRDGTAVVSSGNNSDALILPVEFFDISAMYDRREHLVERACALAGHGLTEDEWRAVMPTIPYHETCPTPAR